MSFAKLYEFDDIGQVLVTLIEGFIFIYVKDSEGDLLEQVFAADEKLLEDIDEIDAYVEATTILAQPNERSDLH